MCLPAGPAARPGGRTEETFKHNNGFCLSDYLACAGLTSLSSLWSPRHCFCPFLSHTVTNFGCHLRLNFKVSS